jgi:hypothetical protein
MRLNHRVDDDSRSFFGTAQAERSQMKRSWRTGGKSTGAHHKVRPLDRIDPRASLTNRL